jgi:hypothetical protein
MLALAAPPAAPTAGATCIPFPCGDCSLLANGQMSLVVMDRGAGTIEMIPNIRLSGPSPDFALVVPTPSLPELGPAEREIWADAVGLTAPAGHDRSGDEGIFDCFDSEVQYDASPPSDEDVIVHGQETINGLRATILSSDDADALVNWLQEHGYAIRAEDAELFTPFIERDWYFTAMRPDSGALEMPQEGWDTNVDPVSVLFRAPEFELPLPILTIHRGARLPIILFVVDDHRMEMPGFATEYANRVSASEHEAIATFYPAVAPYIGEGRFLTRLSRTFTSSASMQSSIFLERAANDDEFRRTGGGGSVFVPELGLLPLPLLALRGWRSLARRRRAASRPGSPRPMT